MQAWQQAAGNRQQAANAVLVRTTAAGAAGASAAGGGGTFDCALHTPYSSASSASYISRAVWPAAVQAVRALKECRFFEGTEAKRPKIASKQPWSPPMHVHQAAAAPALPFCQLTCGKQPNFLQAGDGQAKAGVAIGQIGLVVLQPGQQWQTGLRVGGQIWEWMKCA